MPLTTRRSHYRPGCIRVEGRKTGPSVWVYRYWDNTDGGWRKRKVILGTVDEIATKAQAENAAEPYRLIANRENPSVPPPTMEGLIERYVQTMLPALTPPDDRDTEVAGYEKMSQHCARSYRSVIKRWILPRWTAANDGRPYLVREFEHITMSNQIEVWLRSLLRSKQNPAGLAPKTVRHIYCVLKLIFKHAVKWGYISRNPMGNKEGEKLVELPRGSTLRSAQPRALTPQEFLRLFRQFSGGRERLALALVGLLGLRASEAFGLKWGDINFHERVLHLRRGVVEGHVTPLKTEASRADLPLPHEIVRLLLAWRIATPYTLDAEWVFASPARNGRLPFWAGQFMKDHIQPVVEKEGLGHVSWHTFRHSYSAWSKAAGLAAPQIQELLRHANINLVPVYGATPVEAKRQANRHVLSYLKRTAATAERRDDAMLGTKSVTTRVQ